MEIYVMKVFICFLLHLFLISKVRAHSNAADSLWSGEMGNFQNTYRIAPSVPTNYSKEAWIYEYNRTSQDSTQFGRGAGINGDLYFFLSNTKSSQGVFIICLTTNGLVRWTLEPQSVPDMDVVGTSNIVSDRQGVLFYTVSWSGDTIYTAKICRITKAQTSRPVQQCVEDNELYMDIVASLAINEKDDLLITDVSDNTFQSVPAAVNKTTLGLLWTNRHFFGADFRAPYRCDVNSGNMFWIGDNDRLLKFDSTGHDLIDASTQTKGFGADFGLHPQKQILVRPWQDSTSEHSKRIVSSHDVSGRDIVLRWNWFAMAQITENDDITSPVMDDNGTVYLSSMPLVFAIDDGGKTVWVAELATSSEMTTYKLVADCLVMNSKKRVLYIVSGSAYYQKSNFLYFITAVNMDTGKIIERIDLNLGNKQRITLQCPILVGDEMFYFSWRTGESPDLVPFKVTGIQQVQAEKQ